MTRFISFLVAIVMLRLGGIAACVYLTLHGHLWVGLLCLVVGFSLQKTGGSDE